MTVDEDTTCSINGLSNEVIIGVLVYFVFVVLLGIPGNCLIFYVYWSKRNKSSTNVLIMSLASVDFVVCFHRLLDIVLNSLCLAGVNSPGTFRKILYCLNLGWIGASVTVTAIIAVDRYECVCLPKQRKMTFKRTKKSLLVSILVNFVFQIPLYVVVVMDETVSVTLSATFLGLRLVIFLAAFCVILVCYGSVFRAIRQHVRTSAASPQSHHEHQCSLFKKFSQPHTPVRTVADTVPCQSLVDSSLESTNGELRIGDQLPTKTSTSGVHQPSFLANDNLTDLTERWDESEATPPTQFLRVRVPSVTGRRQVAGPALQRRTTLMLFITTVVFLASWLPYGIYSVFEALGMESVFLKTFTKILYVNNVVNPFIYGLANRRFRDDCQTALRKLRFCNRVKH
ncbi:rhodopsin, GQ-coupled-like [Acanthaster planci]|uniref:Rhodopsin, GQ-coupled-like n=1 Tax=Acanthaster planci TaxID=133434 RepID=A0A8B7Z254_ACAPL|nr:rhodopsin, GQ-coupled-like [Acanthaster planci]